MNNKRFDIILACTPSLGIGKNGTLPWHCKEELSIFRTKTIGKVVIMGRKTIENLPYLDQRVIVCLSRTNNIDSANYKNSIVTCNSIPSALEWASIHHPDKKIIIAGGAQIYYECFYTELINQVDCLHMSIINQEYPCDTYININFNTWVVNTKKIYKEFIHQVLTYCPNGEFQYLNALNEVMTSGNIMRGRNGITKSQFVKKLSFDLEEGFPLLTTKKMFTRGIIEELLFFIKGQTDTKILEDKNVNIWKGNTNREFLDKHGKHNRREGVMGPMYGYLWRFYGAPYDEEIAGPQKNVNYIDQLHNIIEKIKEEPSSRRLLITDFDPSCVDQGVLYPCHSVILQFYVFDGCLSMFCFIRSSDMFLGLPFNIASSAMLLTIIAKTCNLKPKTLEIVLGNAHIYEEHFGLIDKQTSRIPYKFPSLTIEKELKDIKDMENLTVEDFVFTNYQHHPGIKAKMVA